MIKIADNFGYQGPKSNFDRDYYRTKESLKSVTDDKIDDGHLAYCSETQIIYEYLYSNSIDPETGKWREYKPIDLVLTETSENIASGKSLFDMKKDIEGEFKKLGDKLASVIVDEELDLESENQVENRVVKAKYDAIGIQLANLEKKIKEVVAYSDVEDKLSETSLLPVQGKVIHAALVDIEEQIKILTERVDDVEPLDKELDTTSKRPIENRAIYSKMKDTKDTLEDLLGRAEVLKWKNSYSYCAADWTEGDLKPTANKLYGDPEICREWDFYLIDHTKLSSDGTRCVPEAKLQRNNILRDEHGNFAKTVFTNLLCKGIYEYDEMGDGNTVHRSVFALPDDQRIYRDPSCSYQVENDPVTGEERYIFEGWTVGDFKHGNAIEELYVKYGKDQKLYFKDDVFATHELKNLPRPWEEYQELGRGFNPLKSVVLANSKKVYLVDQVKGKSGKIWKGIFRQATTWDGIDVSKYPLDTTGIMPSPMTCVTEGSLQKSFCRYVEYYNPSDLKMSANCQGHLGNGNISDCFMSENYVVDGTNYKKFIYGRSNDVSQLTNCTWARNNNPVVQKPYPFAEGGYHSRNVFVSSQETLYATKYLNETSFFASGISANDAVSNETQWKSYGGIRWRVKKPLGQENEWSYGTWNTTPSTLTTINGVQVDNRLYTNASRSTTHFNALLAYWFPKEQVLESQTAASIAVEYGVEPGETFEFGNGEWWYADVPRAKTLKEGYMNCIIYKKIPYTFRGYNYDGNMVDFELEIILRMSLMSGYNHSGDYWIYYGGGYEQVGTVTNPPGAATGHPVDIYTCFDQTKWRSQSELQTVTMNNLGKFVFESDPNYWKAWSGLNLGDSYTAERPSYTAYKSKSGGSLGTGECFWSYTSKNWSSTLNQRVRVGNLQGSETISTFISYRAQYTKDGNMSSGSNTVGGSEQVLLELD